MSVGEELFVPNLDEKMKHTRDYKKKGFKGNTRGSHIQAPFATLEELFKKLPNNVGFNMELSKLNPHCSLLIQELIHLILVIRIPHAPRKRRRRNGHLRRRNQLLRRHRPHHRLRSWRGPQHDLLLLQPGHLPPPLVQTAVYPRPLPHGLGRRRCRRYSREQFAGGDSVCVTVEFVGCGDDGGTVGVESAAGEGGEGVGVGVRVVWDVE